MLGIRLLGHFFPIEIAVVASVFEKDKFRMVFLRHRLADQLGTSVHSKTEPGIVLNIQMKPRHRVGKASAMHPVSARLFIKNNTAQHAVAEHERGKALALSGKGIFYF